MSTPMPTPTLPAIMPLPPTFAACASCGQRVAPEDAGEAVELTSAGRVGDREPHGAPPSSLTVTVMLTRCRSCQAIVQRAADLLAEHPRVSSRIGGHDVAMHRVECALDGLDALGHAGPAIDSDRDLWLLLEHLTVPGALARWASRFVPAIQPGADPATCAAEPWAHLVREEVRAQRLRDGFAALLRALTEQPGPVLCPSGGCMLCGVWAVQALPSQADRVWTPRRAVPPGALGGRLSPDLLSGSTCPTCEAAIVEVGSIGPTAMERALVAFLGVRQRSLTPTEVVGLTGWAALSEGAEPNATPWAHVPNLAGLTDELLSRS